MKIRSVNLDDDHEPTTVLAELTIVDLARIYEALTHPRGHLSEMGRDVDGPIVGPIGAVLYRYFEDGHKSVIEAQTHLP